MSAIFISAEVDDRRWDLNFEDVLETSQRAPSSRPCLQLLAFRVADSRDYDLGNNDGFGLTIGNRLRLSDL